MNTTCPSCGFDFEEDEPRAHIDFYDADVCEDCIRKDWIFELICDNA